MPSNNQGVPAEDDGGGWTTVQPAGKAKRERAEANKEAQNKDIGNIQGMSLKEDATDSAFNLQGLPTDIQLNVYELCLLRPRGIRPGEVILYRMARGCFWADRSRNHYYYRDDRDNLVREHYSEYKYQYEGSMQRNFGVDSLPVYGPFPPPRNRPEGFFGVALMRCGNRNILDLTRSVLYGQNKFIFEPTRSIPAMAMHYSKQPYLLPGTLSEFGMTKGEIENKEAVAAIMDVTNNQVRQNLFASTDPLIKFLRMVGLENIAYIKSISIEGGFRFRARHLGLGPILPVYAVIFKHAFIGLKEVTIHRRVGRRTEYGSNDWEIRLAIITFHAELPNLGILRLGDRLAADLQTEEDMNTARFQFRSGKKKVRDEWAAVRQSELVQKDRKDKQLADLRGWENLDVREQRAVRVQKKEGRKGTAKAEGKPEKEAERAGLSAKADETKAATQAKEEVERAVMESTRKEQMRDLQKAYEDSLAKGAWGKKLFH